MVDFDYPVPLIVAMEELPMYGLGAHESSKEHLLCLISSDMFQTISYVSFVLRI